MAGGTPCGFNSFHVTDSETFASVGMRHVLPSRDLVADMNVSSTSSSSRSAFIPDLSLALPRLALGIE